MSLRRPVVGLITIGQSPRVDVVPDMAKVIGPLPPYEEEGPGGVRPAGGGPRQAGGGPVRVERKGVKPKTRDELQSLTGAPVLLANLLVARVIAEVSGA